MTDPALRLLWALPLVLGLGCAAILLLRRFMAGAPDSAQEAARLRLCESLALSEQTRLHLVEVEGIARLIVESGARVSVHESTPAGPYERTRALPAWLNGLRRKQ